MKYCERFKRHCDDYYDGICECEHDGEEHECDNHTDIPFCAIAAQNIDELDSCPKEVKYEK